MTICRHRSLEVWIFPKRHGWFTWPVSASRICGWSNPFGCKMVLVNNEYNRLMCIWHSRTPRGEIKWGHWFFTPIDCHINEITQKNVRKSIGDTIKECLQGCLLMAIIHGRVRVGGSLIDCEQRLASTDEPFRQPSSFPLPQAICSLGRSQNEVEFVRMLLIHRADVRKTNQQGDTA